MAPRSHRSLAVLVGLLTGALLAILKWIPGAMLPLAHEPQASLVVFGAGVVVQSILVRSKTERPFVLREAVGRIVIGALVGLIGFTLVDIFAKIAHYELG